MPLFRRIPLLGTIVISAMLSAFAPAVASDFKVKLQQRKESKTPGRFRTESKRERWKPSETAVIVCDMWDLHHCLNAVRRETEMAPRVNAFLEKVRADGALIIHAPSSCMQPYENHPGRKRAKDAPRAANLPKDIGEWCSKIPEEERGTYPIDQTDGGEDDDPVEHAAWAERLKNKGLNPRAPWTRQINILKIHDNDAISDSGVEIWNLLEQRGIKNVMLCGVHVNMCVAGRPFGLRQLARNGKHVVLVRDLTDSMYNPAKRPQVSHFKGTELFIEHIEKYIAPTITSNQLLGGKPFHFQEPTPKSPLP